MNRQRSPRPLPSSKPTLSFFPKYCISLPASGDPAETLQAVMEEIGFGAATFESGKRYSEKGSVFGDVSIEWTKLRISEMEGPRHCLSIAYGGPVLFDTGDLWKFARELEGYLASKE